MDESVNGRASGAGAHVSRVEAGHLSLISNPADVTEVILAAIDARGSLAAELAVPDT